MTELQKSSDEENDDNYGSYYSCMDCEWSGHVDDCEFDYDYDEFSGRDIKYPICPKCGGGVDC